jgi:hypothetical protein
MDLPDLTGREMTPVFLYLMTVRHKILQKCRSSGRVVHADVGIVLMMAADSMTRK